MLRCTATTVPSRVPSLRRRAALIYAATIVLPVCGLVWLGIQSFDRQRQALAALQTEKVSAELESQTRDLAGVAMTRHAGPIAKTFFVIEHGQVVEPAIHSPLPRPSPPEFARAEREELEEDRPDLALASYRRLLGQGSARDALVLSRVARCLSKLGLETEARVTWRTLADTHPDERDLSDRPFGIVARIRAGDTSTLYLQVTAGRWRLAADQAEYFVNLLAPGRRSDYLDTFQFARALQATFRPDTELQPGGVYSSTFHNQRIFYRVVGPDRLEGFLVNADWVTGHLRPGIEREVGVADGTRRDLVFYGGAVALVLLVLTAGVLLLIRDVARESRANHLRAEFVSGVSHELKTPITLIRLYGETLLRMPAVSDAERRDFYGIIARESTRLGRLVERILTLSRVDRGEHVFEFEEGDVAPVVRSVINDYREWFGSEGFTIAPEIVDAPAVRFDAAALSQALINLLDNAVKYSGGSRDIVVRLASDCGEVTVEVEDHGVGIPTADQARIFERFYRGNTTKGGYGLGLFMVRHIMIAHGGRAEVESAPGHGSRFRLVFPVLAHGGDA